MIGVDRWIIPRAFIRLEAYERFLIANPESRGKITYLQITPKSRAEIKEYAEMEQAVERHRRPHQRHLSAMWPGRRCVTPTAPIAGRRWRDFIAPRGWGLVTPLRDGMNLVAKEYVAAQDTADPGVLILSRFAGAAAEFKEAPCSSIPMIRIRWPPPWRGPSRCRWRSASRRHAALFDALLSNDISKWGDRFLSTLMGTKTFDLEAAEKQALWQDPANLLPH